MKKRVFLLCFIAAALLGACDRVNIAQGDNDGVIGVSDFCESVSGEAEEADTLKFKSVSESETREYSSQSIYMEADIGREVKAVRLFVEQWHEGSCVQSISGVFTENTRELNSILSFKNRKGNNYDLNDGGIALSADEYGGIWSVDLIFPGTQQITDLQFYSFQEGNELVLKPGEECVLSALLVNAGYSSKQLDCKTLSEHPEQFQDVEYAVVLRAMFEAEAVEMKPAYGRGPLKLQMLDLTNFISVEDEQRKVAYLSALEKMVYDVTSPEGEDWSLCPYNDIVIYDVDFDGKEELIIYHHGGIYSDNRIMIYDYNVEQNVLYSEFDGFHGLTFYDNGVVKVHRPYNRGPSGGQDTFWPYILYRYNSSSDCYEEIAFVEGWYRSENFESYEGKGFPEEADTDGDGMVYFINVGEWYVYEDPIDNATYEAWVDSVIGDAGEINISFTKLPQVIPEPKG